ncbi:MAG: AsmA family protein [Herminiimonas sp.]|nr:AsmA family protein [Herminiimonas sp.]
MKTFAKILGIVLLAVALIVIAVAIFISQYDWDRARPWINEKVSEAIDRPFVIDGHLAVRWDRPASVTGLRSLVPWPTFTAEKIRVGNPTWARRPEFATADAVTFVVEVLPLLAHRIVIPQIALTNPVIDMERNLDNQNNWTFRKAPKSPAKWQVSLSELVFADGVLTVVDQPTKIDMQAIVATIGAPIALGAIVDKQQQSNKEAVTAVAGTAATVKPGAAPAAPATDVKPADIKTKDDKATVPVTAALPMVKGEEGYGFGLTMSGTYRGAKLNGTGKIGGALSLIDRQRPFPLQADIRLGDNHVIVSGTIIDPGALAAVDVQLSLAAPNMADLYDLTGVALPDTPKFRTSGHLTGNLSAAGNHFKYDRFAGQVGQSDLNGTLEFTSTPPRPRLTGTVHSKRLALADLGPAIGGANPSVAAKPAASTSERALPGKAFKTDRWRAMDADVVFTGASIIRNEALPITDMSTHVIMKDGVLSFDPLKFGVAGGTMTGTIRLDGSKAPLTGKFDLAARHLQLKRMFPTFAPMNTSFGEVNGDARLSGRGNSTAALAATANGEIKMLVNDGAISNTLLETAGLNVANIVIGKLFGDKIVQINCAAADFVVKDGVLDSRAFALDTTDALINVDGTINLATEHMMLNVYPHTKGFRVFSLRSPLYVKGTFKHPDVGVMKGPLAIRGAAALALGVVNPFASLFALLAPSHKDATPCPDMVAEASRKLKGAPAIAR